MTEAEWLAGTGPSDWPHRLFNWLFFTGASDRKLRLSCVAWCRTVAPFSDAAPLSHLLELIEGVADGSGLEERVNREVESIRSREREWYQALFSSESGPTLREEVEHSVRCAILNAGSPHRDREWHHSRKQNPYPCYVATEILNATELFGQRDAAERSITRLLRDIFGNPFRPVNIDPAWLTPTAVGLAEGIYADRAFDRMPILADALQDAGCENAAILGHCRGDGVHVRGCWVVDGVLGKG
ncbi:hypothetical protein [Limnoglobus roseus]|uniref:SMI1/KNR4 family protein n=1 Tax=Limnoglobus roseus TaxID=2598579 RepID=A0A5C1AHL9_9BACT|nr:hypothetical protein [Limnoglobus roseus]QEL17763.1 hypothetical protein PX52LOC_04769 [Limnoglobus roseus]